MTILSICESIWERRTSNSKDKMRGFFAALRMTKEKREIRLAGKPRRSAAFSGVVAAVS
jgi:hypothetical protein